MNIIDLNVPDLVKHLSDWKEYSIPYGHCIVDKSITGCGFTELCLRNEDNIILCSPRKLLLKNKVKQHFKDLNIIYLENTFDPEEYDKDNLSEKKKLIFDDKGNLVESQVIMSQVVNNFLGIQHKETPEEKMAKLQKLYQETRLKFKKSIDEHLELCRSLHQPVKLLVTYDSSHYVTEYLLELGLLDSFKVVVDEFQQIWGDASLKPTTELELVESLQICKNACYVSATPALESYLNDISEFKDLDYYKMHWTERYTTNVPVIIEEVDNAYSCIKAIIRNYLNGNYPTTIVEEGDKKSLVYSKEAIVYFNSLKNIIDLIKFFKLTPDNTMVICSDTEYNRERLEKVGFTVSMPNIEENRHLNKMFTLCTRTVYLGADFYYNSACSFIVSNPNVSHLAVDIALDLPQILGRQRSEYNPFKNHCVLFYQNSNNILSKEELDAEVQRKLNSSKVGIEGIESGFKSPEQITWVSGRIIIDYSRDYIGYSKKERKFNINRLVLAAEKRFWEIKESYKNGILVKKALDESGISYHENGKTDSQKWIDSKVNEIHSIKIFADKLRVYCEVADALSGNPSDFTYFKLKARDPENKFKTYYDLLGSKVLKSCKYREVDIVRRIYAILTKQEESLRKAFISNFVIGQVYSLKETKKIIGKIYESLNITEIKPMANSILGFFEVKYCNKIDKSSGKREKFYKILSVKP